MFKHLLVPLDGSELAEAALPAAMTLAKQSNGKITLIQVTPTPYLSTMLQGDTYTQLSNNLRKLAHEEAVAYLRGHQDAMRSSGCEVHICVAEGDQVTDILLENTHELGIDAIVMCTHGRSGIRRWIFGSIADKLLRQANVPILLVRTVESEDSNQ